MATVEMRHILVAGVDMAAVTSSLMVGLGMGFPSTHTLCEGKRQDLREAWASAKGACRKGQDREKG